MDSMMRLFVKNYADGADPQVRSKCGKAAGFVGIATNSLLFCVKLAAGLLSGSMALIADAVNNLTDSTSSIVMLVGFKLSEKPADEGHPFGHARIEYITGVIISFIILFLGVQLGFSSAEKIMQPEETRYTVLTYVILVFSILLKIWQMLFYHKVGKHVESGTLIATAGDSRNDAIATAAILAGAVITQLADVNLDGFMGVAVAVFIVVSGVKFVMETANPLLGKTPERELVKKIHERILSYDGVLGFHDLTVHDYGAGRCFASVHCEVSAEQDILISHDIIDRIERDFLKDMGIHMVIHLDPVVTNDMRTNALKAQVKAVIKQRYPEISMHDFRVVWGITHTNVVFDVAVPFSVKDRDEEIKREIAACVCQINPICRVVLTIDRTSMVYLDNDAQGTKI